MPDSRFATEAANAAFSGYEGTIFDAFFAPGTYGPQLQLKVQLDHPESFPAIESGIQTVYLGVGNGWEIRGDGTEIYHESGEAKKINAQTQYGILLKRLEKGELENYQAFLDAISADWSPYKAASWKNLKFVFGDVEYPMRRPKTDDAGNRVKDDKGKDVWEETTGTRVMPVKFTGIKGGPSSNGQLDPINVETLNLSDDLKTAVAKSLDAPDYKTFLSAFKGDEFGAVFTAVPNKETYAALQAGSAETF